MKQFTLAMALLAVASVASLGEAGSDTGPGTYTRIVEKYSSTTIFERYVGKQVAVLELKGDGDTDLDIYVYDAAGNLVAWGVGPTDRERVTFTPCVTGNYRIVIRNLGGVWNRFQLHTN